MQAHPQSSPAARIPVTPSPPQAASTDPRPSGLDIPFHPPPQRQPQTWARYRLISPPSVSAAEAADAQTRPAIPAAASARSVAISEGAGLAHDAGNLLGALGLYCDLLRAPGVLRPEHCHYATELSLISSRSSEMIRRLLAMDPALCQPAATTALEQVAPHRDLPKADWPQTDFPRAGRCALEFQPTDVRRRDASPLAAGSHGLTLASVLRSLSPVLGRIAAGSAHVSVCAPATLPALDLTGETLERITVNLVRNAAEAIRTQRLDPHPPARPIGQIRVALALVGGRLQLTVEDNGPGVPPAVAAAFLQPGPMPADTTRGFGHRIVHELVNASGGQLSIRVRPNQGTVFCIKWPAPHPGGEQFDPTNPPALPGPSRHTVQGEPSTC